MKEINGYNGYYIDRFGIVWSTRSGKLSALKPSLDNNGYTRVTLRCDGTQKTKKIHRLVAEAFIKNFQNKPTVNHRNGIRSDNRIENLEWATYSEQQRHSYDILKRRPTYTGKFGYEHCRSKEVFMFDANGDVVGIFPSQSEASRATGICQTVISNSCNKKSKTRCGYNFGFTSALCV